jgi:uncharacterized protein YggE
METWQECNNMKMRWLAPIFALVITAVVVASCTNQPAATTTLGQVQSSNTIAANAVQAPALSTQGTGIWVTGQGTVSAAPDIANLSMGVQVQAVTVSEALGQAAQAMNSVIAALKAKGVADLDIQTQGFNISPVYGQNVISVPPVLPTAPSTTPPPPASSPNQPAIVFPGQPVIIGYSVTNTVSIIVRNLNNAGTIIDAAAQAGGNSIRIQSIYFSISDPTKYFSQARALAVTDAKTKAQQLATSSGVTLGAVTYIAENQGYAVPVYSSGAAVPSAATPINPGQTQVTITVQMAFGIR